MEGEFPGIRSYGEPTWHRRKAGTEEAKVLIAEKQREVTFEKIQEF